MFEHYIYMSQEKFLTIEMLQRDYDSGYHTTIDMLPISSQFNYPTLIISHSDKEPQSIILLDNGEIVDYNVEERSDYLVIAYKDYPQKQIFIMYYDNLDTLVYYCKNNNFNSAFLFDAQDLSIYYNKVHFAGNEKMQKYVYAFNAPLSQRKNVYVSIGNYATPMDASIDYRKIVSDYPYAFVINNNGNNYSIVLSVSPTLSGAQDIIESIRKKGYEDARITFQ